MKRTLATWDPFDEMENLRGLARVLAPRTGNHETDDHSLATSSWAPAVDIAEDEKEYLIKADLPEVAKEDVNVTFDNGMLTLSGERRFEKSEEDETRKYHRVERSYGSYSRSFRLPEMVDAEALTAEFRDGVLTVHLPKREELKPRQIEVTVN